MEKAKIAVIMTVHNRRDTTVECLKRLYQQNIIEDISLDVYLTVDGCTDGTCDAVKEQFPPVNIIKGDGSLFWNRGMYVAWMEASKSNYDFYLWLNDDTMLFQNALDTLFRTEEEQGGNVIVVGSICSPQDKNKITYGGRKHGKPVHPQGGSVSVKTFNGNIVLIPKVVFEKVGYNDPYYRHAFGDTDYGLRAYENGIISMVTDSFVGSCERHDDMRKCWNSNYKFMERVKFLYSPLGFPPKEIFYYNYRHFGILSAIEAFLHCHLKTFFPNL
jgi:GT2 family glycosyltransferase